MFTFVTHEGSFADFVRTHIAPMFATVAFSIEAVREFQFRVISQVLINYHDSPVSEGKAGDVRGGDRLPWVVANGQDNYAPLHTIGWQVHVYGAAPADLDKWCERNGVPLRVFEWSDEHQEAGLARDAAYLLRPDTYVALADSSGSAEALARYFSQRNLVART